LKTQYVSHSHPEEANALLMLREIADKIAYRILLSTMKCGKTASEICFENGLPLSSTYKKIQKLFSVGLMSIENISIDDNGKKVISYKSKFQSLEFSLTQNGMSIGLKRV